MGSTLWRAYRARLMTIIKDLWDAMCRQLDFKLFCGSTLLTGTKPGVCPRAGTWVGLEPERGIMAEKVDGERRWSHGR
jgi:hypothetical protein